MKAVKYIITAFVILFCFALGSEIYQSHLRIFSNRYFYIEIDNEERELTCVTVALAAEKYNENVFAVDRNDIDAFHSQMTIYASEDTRERLISECSITEGAARSLFSGSTEISFRPFDEVSDNKYNKVLFYRL